MKLVYAFLQVKLKFALALKKQIEKRFTLKMGKLKMM